MAIEKAQNRIKNLQTESSLFIIFNISDIVLCQYPLSVLSFLLVRYSAVD